MPSEQPAGAYIESRRRRPRRFLIPLAALLALAGLAAYCFWRGNDGGKPAFGDELQGETPAAKKALAPFESWDKPDFVLVLSGEEHGYLQPCGCSHPQLGGLTRRYNFIQMLKKRGWDVVSLDVGDIAPASGLQAMLKYTTSMKALKLMGVAAVGIGANEMGLPLISALGEYALNNPSPAVLAANLLGMEKEEAFHGMVKPWTVAATRSRQKIGIVGAVGPSVIANVKDPDVKFSRGRDVLPKTLKEIQDQEKPNFLVLLYEGSEKEAVTCAKALQSFNVVLHLSSDSEPPSVTKVVGNTSLVTLGHKGRFVGVLGAFRHGKKYTLKYHLMALGEEFETPKGMEKNHPIMKLMEGYAEEVKNKGFLSQATVRKVSHPVQLAFPAAKYVGAQACQSCHEQEHKIWKGSLHSHAYENLTKARNPSLRHLDPDCVRCHVTGYDYKTGFTDEASSKPLLNNGCESCHGPGSEHVAMEKSTTADNKKDRRKIRDLMNPFRFEASEDAVARKRRLGSLAESCMHCHDTDNDVNWDLMKRWNKIVHSGDKVNKND